MCVNHPYLQTTYKAISSTMSYPPSFEELVCLHFGWTITRAHSNFAGPHLKLRGSPTLGDLLRMQRFLLSQAVPKSTSRKAGHRVPDRNIEGTCGNHWKFRTLTTLSERWHLCPNCLVTAIATARSFTAGSARTKDLVRGRNEKEQTTEIQRIPKHSKIHYQIIKYISNGWSEILHSFHYVSL